MINKNRWTLGAYLIGISSMFMTTASFNVYVLLSAIFYTMLMMMHKDSITPILHVSIVAAASSVLFQWWTGSPFNLIALSALSVVPALAIAAEKGEFFYQKDNIKTMFYYKQLGVALMLPIVFAVILAIMIKNDANLFTAYAILYMSMVICFRLTRQVVVYNVIFILAQLMVWAYVCTYLGDVAIILKVAFAAVLLAMYGFKIKIRR